MRTQIEDQHFEIVKSILLIFIKGRITFNLVQAELEQAKIELDGVVNFYENEIELLEHELTYRTS